MAVHYRAERRRVGSLDCVIVKPTDDVAIRALCVLCHGYGAFGDDLVGLSRDLLESRSSTEPVMLVFPAGVLSLAAEGFGDGRAWWQLSIQRLINAMDQGQYELIREESPPGIDEARIALVGTVQILLSELGLTTRSLLLGGFSQGAMLAMECACLGFDEPIGGLALYSACLIRERQWKPAVAKLATTQIVQSHGDMDMVLPLRTGIWLRELLVDNQCKVDFIQFQGPHTIGGEAIEHTAEVLDDLASQSSDEF